MSNGPVLFSDTLQIGRLPSVALSKKRSLKIHQMGPSFIFPKQNTVSRGIAYVKTKVGLFCKSTIPTL